MANYFLMEQNKQYLVKYNSKDFTSVQNKIIDDWRSTYADCKIVTISITKAEWDYYSALVVFEEQEEL